MIESVTDDLYALPWQNRWLVGNCYLAQQAQLGALLSDLERWDGRGLRKGGSKEKGGKGYV